MKNCRINLNEYPNPFCHKKCNKEKRQDITEEDLCSETKSVSDDLPLRCVGPWGIMKIYHLVQYFSIFSKGMKDKWKGKINYIEICSGPGRCIDRSCGSEFDGTSLCIIQNEACQYLNKAIFFDYNQTVVDTLNQRINNINIPNAIAMIGDYNNPKDLCDKIIKETAGIGLYLIFIDPTDCSVPFDLISTLKYRLRNVDLIINIATGTDFNRNIGNAIASPSSYHKAKDKYKAFLGPNSDFFFNTPGLSEYSSENLRNLFRDAYVESLRSIGYSFFDFKAILHYYNLIFATSNEKGIEFWKKVNKYQYDGQGELF